MVVDLSYHSHLLIRSLRSFHGCSVFSDQVLITFILSMMTSLQTMQTQFSATGFKNSPLFLYIMYYFAEVSISCIFFH